MNLSIKLFSIVIFLSFNLLSQQNQTYSGNFSNDEGVVGKATYTYYEKDYVKIKNGNFTYSYNTNGVSRELKGQFNEGLREGLWSSSIAGRGLEVNITGTFKNGLPNGKFNYIANYNGSIYQTMSVEFKNGVVVGDFAYEDKRKGEKVSGKITPEGVMDGDWKIAEGNTEYIQKYENGVFTLYIERNVNDGNITRKDDYLLPLQNLQNEDIIIKDAQWDLTNSEDVYGVYLQKLWDNWDPKSVGGIKDNPITGMFFKRKSAKIKMKEYGLSILDEEFFKSINFNKEDSINTVFLTFRNYNDKIKETNWYFESVRNNILTKEVKLRDSIKVLVDRVILFQPQYIAKNQDYQKLLDYNDLLIRNIKGSIQVFEDLKKSNYNGKQFSGLVYPSINQFNLEDLIKSRSVISGVKKTMNFQSANDLVMYLPQYDSLLIDFNTKLNAIESSSENEQKKYFKLSDPQLLSEPKKAFEELTSELTKLTDEKNKFLLINNGDKINEKLLIIQDFYFTSLSSEYTLPILMEYISKLKKLNQKMEEVLKSEEVIKTLLKETKKEESAQVLEQLFLK